MNRLCTLTKVFAVTFRQNFGILKTEIVCISTDNL